MLPTTVQCFVFISNDPIDNSGPHTKGGGVRDRYYGRIGGDHRIREYSG